MEDPYPPTGPRAGIKPSGPYRGKALFATASLVDVPICRTGDSAISIEFLLPSFVLLRQMVPFVILPLWG